MSRGLVTLRKHRNYALRERETGYNTNNQNVDSQVVYAWGSKAIRNQFNRTEKQVYGYSL